MQSTACIDPVVTAATRITAVEEVVIRRDPESVNDLPNLNLQSVLLECRVEQNTTALETSWMFDGVQIDNTPPAQFAGRVSIGFSRSGSATELRTTLLINRLLYNDTGEYTCEVRSTGTPANPVSATVTLLLKGMVELYIMLLYSILEMLSTIIIKTGRGGANIAASPQIF